MERTVILVQKKLSRQAVAGIHRGLGSNSLALQQAGVTTRELGDVLTRKALLWVWRWGWASPSTIDFLTLDGARRGKAARLESRGFLKAFKPGSFAPDAPRKVLRLTDAGLEELSRLHDSLDLSLADVPVRWNQLRHDYIVQNMVAECVVKMDAKYFSGPELAARQKEWPKVPDAIINDVVIELETTPKKEGELHRAAYGLAQLSAEGRKIRIISTQKPILAAYEKLLAKGSRIKRYVRNSDRTWSNTGFHDPIQIQPQLDLGLLKSTVPSFDKTALGVSMYRIVRKD